MSILREQIIKRFTRSSGWSKVRATHIKLHPYCEVCGKKINVEVHHIKPFHTDPTLELDPKNLLTLCGDKHHIEFGHLGDWDSWNPSVMVDAKAWHVKRLTRPYKKGQLHN